MIEKLKKISNPEILEIRGKGLMIGIELKGKARPYCEKLMDNGILAKETHENIIRLAPPLVVSKEDLDWAIDIIGNIFNEN